MGVVFGAIADLLGHSPGLYPIAVRVRWWKLCDLNYIDNVVLPWLSQRGEAIALPLLRCARIGGFTRIANGRDPAQGSIPE